MRGATHGDGRQRDGALPVFIIFFIAQKRFIQRNRHHRRAQADGSSQSLFSFYDYPAAHWVHVRTSNPIRVDLFHRADADQTDEGCASRNANLTMV